MTPAKTNAQRQAALKARRKAVGLVPVTVWVHRDWVEYIKMVASGARQLKVDAEAIDNELSAEESLMRARRFAGIDDESLQNERIGS